MLVLPQAGERLSVPSGPLQSLQCPSPRMPDLAPAPGNNSNAVEFTVIKRHVDQALTCAGFRASASPASR